jgi:23S rRNA (guanosine2251-2'-O)-methyltransferase
MDLLYGRNAVAEALRAGRRRVRRVLVARGAHGLDGLIGSAVKRHVPVDRVERTTLDRLVADAHHQGVVAEVEPFPYARLEDVVLDAALLLVLDSLQDPQNFGTLLRTAQACGVTGVVIPEHRAVGVTPAVSNASAGAIEHVHVARVTNLARSLEWLKQHGVWVYGLAVGARQPFWAVDWTTPSALVVGAEGAGLSRLVGETCDALLTIPMAAGAVQSLNAAVAGSLVLYEAHRQREHRVG